MKKRIGFVSNSSSSSFIIAIGVVTDWAKFKKWKNKNDDIQVYSPDETKKRYSDISRDSNGYYAGAPVNNTILVKLSFDDYNSAICDLPKEVIAKNLLSNKENGDIVVYCVGNNEGDGAFYNQDDLDYDIDIDWFNQEQRRIYKEFGADKSGISFPDKTYGAERNG